MHKKTSELDNMIQGFWGKCPILVNYGTYVASGAQVVNNYYGERRFKESVDETSLASYILDDELRNRIIYALHECKETKEVYTKALSLLRQSGAWNRNIMTSKSFLAALIPHLTAMMKKPTVDALYMAVYRQI